MARRMSVRLVSGGNIVEKVLCADFCVDFMYFHACFEEHGSVGKLRHGKSDFGKFFPIRFEVFLHIVEVAECEEVMMGT